MPSTRRTVGNPVIAGILSVSLVLGAYALFYLLHHVELPDHLVGGGQWQFLTNLSLLYTLIVFAIGIAAHVLRSPTLFNLKNKLHPVALVLECVVTAVYWPLRLLLVHLLVKDPKRVFIPMHIDLCLHLLPVVTLLIDFLVFLPRWTIATESSLAACVVLTSLYWFWLKQVVDFDNGGEYPYLFLNTDTEQTRVLIFAMVGLVGFALFLFCKKLYDIVVHPEVEQAAEVEMKKAQ